MYISKEELEILEEIESFLFDMNKDKVNMINGTNNFITDTKGLNDVKAMELYLKLYSIIEKLSQARKIRNEKTRTEINKKRKENKLYARSKKEIERYNKNNN